MSMRISLNHCLYIRFKTSAIQNLGGLLFSRFDDGGFNAKFFS